MSKSIEQQAFDRLLNEIEGDKSKFISSAQFLINYAKNGDYQGRYAMTGLIPEDDWHWPAYDEQIVQEARLAMQWEVDLIRQENATTLLTRLKIDELRKIGSGKAKGKSKKEIIDKLVAVLNESELAELVELARTKLLDAILSFTPKYEDRCAHFLMRLGQYYFSMDKAEEMRRSFKSLGNLNVEFWSGHNESTPLECIQKHGMTLPISEVDFLAKAPCHKLNCSCTWVVSIDFSKPITPGGYISKIRSTLHNENQKQEEMLKELSASIDNFFIKILQLLKSIFNRK